MDIEKEIEQAKNDLAGYEYHQEKINELMLRYEQVRTLMSKLKSPNLDAPTTHSSNESIEPLLKQLKIKDNIVNQLRESLIIIKRADRILDNIKDKEDKELIIKAFVKHEYISNLANANYYSFNGMKKKLNSIIKSAILHQ